MIFQVVLHDRMKRPAAGSHALELLIAIARFPEHLMGLGAFGAALRRWLAARARAARTQTTQDWVLTSRGFGVAAWLSIVFVILLFDRERQRLSFNDAINAQVLAAAALMFITSSLSEVRHAHGWARGLTRLREIQKERRMRGPVDDAAPLAGSAQHPLLECRAVSYGDAASRPFRLQAIDLCVRSGESVAIVGSSGSGKTLLAQLLLGVRQPSEGCVLAAGVDLRLIEEEGRSRVLAGVFDDMLVTGGTIDDFLRSAHVVSEERVRQAYADVGIDGWISALPLGAKTPIGRGGAAFASHERRLLCLARLLTMPPRVAILDGSLDAFDCDLARRIARSVALRTGTVVLLTTRADIVPSTFRQLSLVDGRLRPSAFIA
jgi:ABC-type multidrug transport system fused ATPase/permease subunit